MSLQDGTAPDNLPNHSKRALHTKVDHASRFVRLLVQPAAAVHAESVAPVPDPVLPAVDRTPVRPAQVAAQGRTKGEVGGGTEGDRRGPDQAAVHDLPER